ncbi:MAG: tRNA pseudouridine(38-40) synthase TruA [bacterium]
MLSRNLQLILEYDGTPYAGWQKQRDLETVQGTLEDKIFQVTGHPVDVLVAGRTDAGVHALGQAASFRTTSPLSVTQLRRVVNQYLPHSIRVVKIREMPAEFHATYHASAKLYRYVLRNSVDYTVFDRDYYYQVRRPLNIAWMRKAARQLEGSHDFTAFRGSLGKWANPVRVLKKIRVIPKGNEVHLEFLGVSFLHQMVRILSGTLVYAGWGKIRAEDIGAIFKSKDRRESRPTLPSNGLFLVKVFYPKKFPLVKLKPKREEE